MFCFANGSFYLLMILPSNISYGIDHFKDNGTMELATAHWASTGGQVAYFK